MNVVVFRGKNKEGEWVYGSYFCLRHNDGRDHMHHFIIPENTPIPKERPIGEIQVEIDPRTLGQFIWLCDKNKKRIFEGDILKHDDANWGYGGTYDLLHDGYLYDEVKKLSEYINPKLIPNFEDDFGSNEDVEIVGTIYDEI